MAMNNKNYAIEINGLKKIYNFKKANAFEALKGINLNIPKQSIFGLLGANGAGKSTLINIIAGLVKKTEGKVSVWGNDIDNNERNAKLSIGVVPQELILDPFFTPRETLEYQSGYYGVPKKENCVEEILESVGLLDKADAYARSLSGGMRRRLMIGKAMVHRPPILVLDEPTSALDVSVQAQILNLLNDLQKKFNLTYIFISHDLSVIEYMCDRLAVMYLGKVVEEADTEDLFSNPYHPYTKALLSATPSFEKDRKKIMILGDVPSPITYLAESKAKLATEMTEQERLEIEAI